MVDSQYSTVVEGFVFACDIEWIYFKHVNSGSVLCFHVCRSSIAFVGMAWYECYRRHLLKLICNGFISRCQRVELCVGVADGGSLLVLWKDLCCSLRNSGSDRSRCSRWWFSMLVLWKDLCCSLRNSGSARCSRWWFSMLVLWKDLCCSLRNSGLARCSRWWFSMLVLWKDLCCSLRKSGMHCYTDLS